MTQNNSTKMLRVVLLISTIVSLVYGLGFFLIPGILVTISKGNPVDFGWLRWPGGISNNSLANYYTNTKTHRKHYE